MKSLEENNCYKYLDTLEVDNIKHQQMKSQLEKRIRKIWLKKILKSRLNSRNLVKAIYT